MKNVVPGGVVSQVPEIPPEAPSSWDSHMVMQHICLQLFCVTNQGHFSSAMDSWVARILGLSYMVMCKAQCA